MSSRNVESGRDDDGAVDVRPALAPSGACCLGADTDWPHSTPLTSWRENARLAVISTSSSGFGPGCCGAYRRGSAAPGGSETVALGLARPRYRLQLRDTPEYDQQPLEPVLGRGADDQSAPLSPGCATAGCWLWHSRESRTKNGLRVMATDSRAFAPPDHAGHWWAATDDPTYDHWRLTALARTWFRVESAPLTALSVSRANAGV